MSQQSALSSKEDPVLIEVQGLVKTHQTPEGEFLALKGIDIQLGRGEFVALIGKSGSGKTTLLNVLAGFDKADSGWVVINHTNVHALSDTEREVWRKKNLGIISPTVPLDPERTLAENVLLLLNTKESGSTTDDRDQAVELLGRTGLADIADKYPTEISTEHQIRGSIACALANDPCLILADEPTQALDAEATERVLIFFEHLVADGITVLIATAESNLARRVGCTLLLESGEIVSEYLVRALHPLSPDQLIELKQKHPPMNYAAGTPIVQQGEIGDTFYIIVEGSVNVFLERPGDEPLLVNRLAPGSYFGEMAILRQDVRSATIQVTMDGRASLVELNAVTFSDLTNESPDLLREFKEILERRRIALVLQAAAELEPEVFAEISQDHAIREYQPGEEIIRQGQIGKTFFILIDGLVEVVAERGDGQQIRLAELKPGELFGEQALLGARRRNATVRAIGDQPAQVVELQAADLRRLVDRSPSFRKNLHDAVDSRATTVEMKRKDLFDPNTPS